MSNPVTIRVRKRRGNIENYNIEKIRACIGRACEGLDVNPLSLESLFDASIYDGITTTEIQTNLIHHSKTLCSPLEPDWTVVAGS